MKTHALEKIQGSTILRDEERKGVVEIPRQENLKDFEKQDCKLLMR